MKKNNNKGFTLAELLIVVAIIAVLVAIAIPIFTSQLEKAREATDLANLRAAYAEQITALLTWDGKTEIPDITITANQVQDDWQTNNSDTYNIGNDTYGKVEVACSTSSWTVKADTTNNKVTISAGAAAGAGG